MKILVFAGSTRKGSYNKLLAKAAFDALKRLGAEVTFLDLRDYPLPPYDGDLEEREGLPEPAKKLKKIFSEHGALVVASPEYNSSISGTLKNVIDWISRPEKSDASYMPAFNGKFAALMSASPGALGGLRGLVHIRAILNNINVHVIPNQVTVSKAHEAFDDKGGVKDEKLSGKVVGLMQEFFTLLQKIG